MCDLVSERSCVEQRIYVDALLTERFDDCVCFCVRELDRLGILFNSSQRHRDGVQRRLDVCRRIRIRLDAFVRVTLCVCVRVAHWNGDCVAFDPDGNENSGRERDCSALFVILAFNEQDHRSDSLCAALGHVALEHLQRSHGLAHQLAIRNLVADLAFIHERVCVPCSIR